MTKYSIMILLLCLAGCRSSQMGPVLLKPGTYIIDLRDNYSEVEWPAENHPRITVHTNGFSDFWYCTPDGIEWHALADRKDGVYLAGIPASTTNPSIRIWGSLAKSNGLVWVENGDMLAICDQIDQSNGPTICVGWGPTNIFNINMDSTGTPTIADVHGIPLERIVQEAWWLSGQTNRATDVYRPAITNNAEQRNRLYRR